MFFFFGLPFRKRGGDSLIFWRRKEELEGGVLQRSFLEGVLDAEKTRNQRVIFFWGILSWRELQVGSLRRKPEVSGKSLSGKKAVLSSLGMTIMSIFTLYFLIFLSSHH